MISCEFCILDFFFLIGFYLLEFLCMCWMRYREVEVYKDFWLFFDKVKFIVYMLIRVYNMYGRFIELILMEVVCGLYIYNYFYINVLNL